MFWTIFLVSLFIIMAATLAGFVIASWRLWKAVEFRDNCFDELFVYLNNLNSSCSAVLHKEIYTDDPVIRGFVDIIKDIQPIISKINSEYVFADEIPETAKPLLGYNQFKK